MDPADGLERCSLDELTDAIGQLHGLESAVRRSLLRLIVAYDRRRGPQVDGAASMAEWLCRRIGLSFAVAAEYVEVAYALERLPAIDNAFERGALSWEQLRAVVRFAQPETDEELAREAPGMSVAFLEATARRARSLGERAVRSNTRRFVRWWWDHKDGAFRISGRLAPDQGAVVETALRRICDQMPRQPDELNQELTVRAADALHELASARLADDQDADRATVVVHVDADVLIDGEGTAEIEDGPVIDAAIARRLACDGRIELVAHAANGEPIGVGRRRRQPPPWLMRQLKKRDRCCRFPGCSRRAFVQAHHKEFWTRDEGPTDLDKLVLLCRCHHRLMHEGGWSIRGDPNGDIEFIRPDGRVLETRPPELRTEIRTRFLPQAETA